jgi:hypothetical protein
LGKTALAVHGNYKLSESEEKARLVKSKFKSMLIIFFDFKGIVHKQIVLASQTANY